MDKEGNTEGDQSKGTEGTESKTGEEGKTASETEKDNQNQGDQGKSNKENANGEQELFELPDGRKVDGKTLSKEWKENFYPEFTRKSQQLSKYNEAEKASKAKAEEQARSEINKDDALSKVPHDVREAIVKIVTPVIEARFKAVDEANAQTQREKAFDAELKSLEEKYNGKNGISKFDRSEVLRAMKDPNNRIFDPEAKFKDLHASEFMDIAIKEALKKQTGGNRTESTGSLSDNKDANKKTPSTFAEAGKALLERLKSQE
jgi:hypothetical protein